MAYLSQEIKFIQMNSADLNWEFLSGCARPGGSSILGKVKAAESKRGGMQPLATADA